jgi:alkyl hydroperoxide reductase subunit AhpC
MAQHPLLPERCVLTYCLSPAAEIVRVIDALQLSARASVATPANWPNNHENIGAKVTPDFAVPSVS